MADSTEKPKRSRTRKGADAKMADDVAVEVQPKLQKKESTQEKIPDVSGTDDKCTSESEKGQRGRTRKGADAKMADDVAVEVQPKLKKKESAQEKIPDVSGTDDKCTSESDKGQRGRTRKAADAKVVDDGAVEVQPKLKKKESTQEKIPDVSGTDEKCTSESEKGQRSRTRKAADAKVVDDGAVEVPPKLKKKESTQEKIPDVSGTDDKCTSESEKGQRSRTRKAADAKVVDAGAVEVPPKLKKKESTREKIPDVSGMDFKCTSESEKGGSSNLKIASWNVNGLRAWIEKDGLSYLKHEKPDILCLQETKCSDSKIPDECQMDGYHAYWFGAEQEGYSGTGMYTRTKPLSVTNGIGQEKHDNEGRSITAEFDDFYLVTAYVPNSGRGLPRLPYRSEEWDTDFRAYLKDLDAKKPVVLCGDLNVAHNEIDLANPKGNKKGPGFTAQEREGFTNLLGEGFVDSFRKLYPDVEGAYSYWTYMGNARGKNVGWRLDYFVISERLMPSVCDSVIRKDVMGSDHCPIALMLSL